MRFKLDENLPVHAAEVLRAAGHDAVNLLDQVAADHIRIAGMHLDFPGYGFVRRDKGRYFIDAE